MQYEIGNRSITQLLHGINNLIHHKIKFSNYLFVVIISCVDVHPYRSEGFGMLSFFRFFLQAMKYTRITDFPILNYYTDNEGLIKRIMKTLFQQHFSPSFAILSEYNVIQTIYVTIKELKTKNILPELSIAHVKGHQDEEKDYEDLSVEAKLYV